MPKSQVFYFQRRPNYYFATSSSSRRSWQLLWLLGNVCFVTINFLWIYQLIFLGFEAIKNYSQVYVVWQSFRVQLLIYWVWQGSVLSCWYSTLHFKTSLPLGEILRRVFLIERLVSMCHPGSWGEARDKTSVWSTVVKESQSTERR